MKAIVIDKTYKVEIRDVPMPHVGEGEALLRVLYVGICGADVASYTGNQPFTTYPRIPGHEFSAEIIEIPENDKGLKKGGTTVLTEVPEMFGAETLLMNRCENEEIFKQTVSLINDFKNYFTSHGQTIYENPSPGNKKGGISTLEEKSLGCTQKSGSSAVRGVLKYGERVSSNGLNLLSAPGNDLVASTALAASGAHIVLFTTGRGTPFASPVPTVKISTNTALSEKKHDWIDFDCGAMVNDKSLSETGEELFEFVLNVASGKKVKSEEKGYHDMAIFKDGVTL